MRVRGFFIAKRGQKGYTGRMKTAILGAGALGCYYGARLAAAGDEVWFIGRSACGAMQEQGLRVQSVDGDVVLPRVHAVRSSADCGPVDRVFVAWKTCCNGLFAEALPPLLRPGTEVITLQNGMGNAEKIAEIVPAEDVYIGLCFVCCMMDEPGVIRHLEGGEIRFAPLVPGVHGLARAQEFAAHLTRAGVPSMATGDAEQTLWTKLTWNIPFNGLCLAHGGISVRQLFTMPEEVERSRRVMEEVCLAAARRGHPTPEAIVQAQMERTRVMGDFIPSSAVDYLRGRPVEYEAIWGEPLRRALAAGVSVPETERLCADIRARLGMA